ncbi:hypothetical protein PRIPAC_95167 [Pristionchus pacificus]|uniref:Uncharacterized protein n=1 Tax=Pristionchus pacificus TaxID=54126 RepID=A0A454XT43_PRIPA|nr:hypothetical protein PRIPAC_95167 [Pristionchus pacificus]|eukprot:PDM63811.1 hypothetical protein PRIPAC_49784 [Pristionchus pacificus]
MMSCRSFLLPVLILGSSQGFERFPMLTNALSNSTEHSNYRSTEGFEGVFVITMMILGGCSVTILLSLLQLVMYKGVQKRIRRQERRANIEMGLSRDGSSVTPRLATAIPVTTSTDSVLAKGSIAYPNNAIYV